ncbi:hypothetical protein ACTXL6_18715 [Brachybacterium tyrofermentans]|uniref:hypothetical protein n=1 Tax=Brachybacterium tyrofermentans TaxID=47848 RepID=UPI003FD0332B
MPQKTSTTETTLELDDLRMIRLIFEEAPRSLSAAEIENLIYTLTYINDSVLQEYAPRFVPEPIPRFGHPRLTTRVRPEGALRISSMSYGSPALMDVIVVAGVALEFINTLGGVAGLAIMLYDRRREDPERQQYLPDVHFHEETGETTTVQTPTVLIPPGPWRDDDYFQNGSSRLVVKGSVASLA